jgi:uncharacterized protein (TIGR00645 family)
MPNRKGPGPMIAKFLERILFASRWLLAPLFVALIVGLVAVVVKAAQQVWEIGTHILTASESATILALLGLVDLTLTGSLVVLVIFSGYENFVSRVDAAEQGNWPEWMSRIDFSGLKLKLLSSIVAISAIELLRAFMDVHDVSDRDLQWYVIIQLVLVTSGLIMALTDRFGPSHAASEKDHA